MKKKGREKRKKTEGSEKNKYARRGRPKMRPESNSKWRDEKRTLVRRNAEELANQALDGLAAFTAMSSGCVPPAITSKPTSGASRNMSDDANKRQNKVQISGNRVQIFVKNPKEGLQKKNFFIFT